MGFGLARHFRCRLLDRRTILNVGAANLDDVGRVRAVCSEELGDDRKGPLRVDRAIAGPEGRTIKVRGAGAVRIEVTASAIALISRVQCLEVTAASAWVGSVRSSHHVCFPDIHLRAAESKLVIHVGLTIDVAHLRTLCVAVAGAERGASVVRALAKVAVGRHLNEVQSAIYATGKGRHINIECKFLGPQLKHLVAALLRIE